MNLLNYKELYEKSLIEIQELNVNTSKSSPRLKEICWQSQNGNEFKLPLYFIL